MQNYRNQTMDYMRRPNCGDGCPSMKHRSGHPMFQESQNCCDREDALEGMPLAMAYVPWQNWKCPYEVEKAICRGTIFEELDKPFRGMGGCNR